MQTIEVMRIIYSPMIYQQLARTDNLRLDNIDAVRLWNNIFFRDTNELFASLIYRAFV